MSESNASNQSQIAPKSRWQMRHIMYGVGGVLIVAIALFLIFIDNIVEYAIEKNDVRFIGREVEISDLDVNLLLGTIHLKNIDLYEANGKDVFVSVRNIFGDIAPLELFNKNILVEEIALDQMVATFAHRGKVFNFDDLIHRFLPDTQEDSDTLNPSLEWDWIVHNIHVDSCAINYHDLALDSKITVSDFNLSSPVISSSSDTFSLATDLTFQDSGYIRTAIFTDFAKRRYDLNLMIDQLRVDYLYKYLKDYLNIASFTGVLSCDLHANGHMQNYSDVSISGDVLTEDLTLTDLRQDTAISFGEIDLRIEEINHSKNSYRLNQIHLNNPILNFELFDDKDNLTSLIKNDSIQNASLAQSHTSIPGNEYFNVFIFLADYVRIIVDEYSKSDYRIESIGVHNGRISYRDHTLNQEAHFLFEKFDLYATSFDTEKDSVVFEMNSAINKVGLLEARWVFNPRDVLEMELDVDMSNFLVALASPYSFHQTAYPFTDGAAFYTGHISIHDRKIVNSNSIYIENIQVGKQGYADPPIKLPVRLAVSLLRDVHGNIELEVPVSGDLDDPNFSYWPAIWTVVKNTLKKIVVAPVNLFASMFSVDEDDLKYLNWTFGQQALEKSQFRSLKSLSKVLESKPEFSVTYLEVNNREKEKDYLATFESKKRYYQSEIKTEKVDSLTSADTLNITMILPRDSSFVMFLERMTSTEHNVLSTPELARKYIGEEKLVLQVENNIGQREHSFRRHLIDDYLIDSSRIALIVPDTSHSNPDTFNLVGPRYLFGFQLDTTSVSQASDMD